MKEKIERIPEETLALSTACCGLIFAGILIALSVLVILRGYSYFGINNTLAACYMVEGILSCVYAACLMIGSVIRILNSNYDLYYLELIGLGAFAIIIMWINFSIKRNTNPNTVGDMAPAMIITIGVVLIAFVYFLSYKNKLKTTTTHDLALGFGLLYFIIIGSRIGNAVSELINHQALSANILAIVAAVSALFYTVTATFGILNSTKRIKKEN